MPGRRGRAVAEAAIPWGPAVTGRRRGRRVEIKDGDQTVAAAEVTTCALQRLRERIQDVTTRPAGSTAIADADVLPGRE